MLKSLLSGAILCWDALRLVPAALLWRLSARRGLIDADIARWSELLHCHAKSKWLVWLKLMSRYPEFRSVFYYRLGWPSFTISRLCRPQWSLLIGTRDIGPGLFFQHGFATIVAARKIGADCWINQQVTIGHKGEAAPVIGDRVRVAAGAKVLGGITVGNDVFIGANAVVVKDIPDGCTVAGVPARIIKRYGQRVDEPLVDSRKRGGSGPSESADVT